MSGQGSIRPKANGWEIRVSAGTAADGRRRRISRYVTGTRADAEQALLRLRLALGDGSVGRGEDTTVGQLLTTWYGIVADDLSPTTRDRYTDIITRQLIPAFGTTRLRRLDVPALERFYRDCTRTRALSPKTVRMYHAILRRAVGEAERWGWVDRNIVKLARPPSASKHEIRPPSIDQVQLLVDRARAEGNDDLADFIHLAAVSGARRGELVGLHWADADLDSQTLTVKRSVARTSEGIAAKSTKTHQSRRFAIDTGTIGMLRARRSRRAEIALACGVQLGPWIFSDDVGCRVPLNPHLMTQRFGGLAERAGVQSRLHDLRHFAATIAIDAGTPITTVSRRLGHRDTSMTLDFYAHALEHSDQAVADLLGATFARKA